MIAAQVTVEESIVIEVTLDCSTNLPELVRFRGDVADIFA